MVKITCETVDCGKVIAEGVDYDDAKEIAIYENNADYHDEAGVWTCAACYDAYMQEGMREAMRYGRELELRAIERESQDAIDSMLDAADLARDIAKENGRI